MAKRKLSDKQLRELQMKQGNGRGPGSRFGGIKEKPKNFKDTLKKILQYISYSKVLLITLIVIVILNTVFSLSSNIVIERILASFGTFDEDNLIWLSKPEYNNIIKYTILLLIVYILVCFLQFITSRVSASITVGMTRKLRNDLFARIVKFPIGYTDTHPHGDIMSRMTNDIDNISMAVTQSITSFVSGILTILGCFVIMLYYSPLLMCVALITLVLSTIFTLLMSKFMRPLFVKQSRILGLLNSQTEEMVTGCKTVIAYNHQDEAEEEFNDYSNELCKTAINAQIWGGSMGPIMNFVGNVGYFLICLFGAIFLIEGIGNGLFGNPLEPAVVITFLTLNKQFTRPINEIANLYGQILTATACAERVFEILDSENEIDEGKTLINENEFKGNIEFAILLENKCLCLVLKLFRTNTINSTIYS